MKLVIFGAIALVVGLAGGTGARVFTSPALPAGADSLIALADSTFKAKAAHGGATHAAAHGTAADPVAHADSAHAATPPTGHDAHAAGSAAASEDHAGATAATAAVASPVAAMPPAIPGPEPERYKQVGSILLNMKPAEAARVIAYLNDTQVHGLLEAMGPRQAAQILSQLPAERAAALSKRLLVTPVTEDR